MRKIVVDSGRDGIELVNNALREVVDVSIGNQFLVQMKLGDRDITELLSVNYDMDFKELQLFWDNDWYNEENEIIILAVASIRDIDITESFPFE